MEGRRSNGRVPVPSRLCSRHKHSSACPSPRPPVCQIRVEGTEENDLVLFPEDIFLSVEEAAAAEGTRLLQGQRDAKSGGNGAQRQGQQQPGKARRLSTTRVAPSVWSGCRVRLMPLCVVVGVLVVLRAAQLECYAREGVCALLCCATGTPLWTLCACVLMRSGGRQDVQRHAQSSGRSGW